jgi:hypothetical protein
VLTTLPRFVAASLCAAIFSVVLFFIPKPLSGHVGLVVIALSGLASLAWMVSVPVAIRRFGVTGAWTLLGAPFGLVMPAMLGLMAYLCSGGYACI